MLRNTLLALLLLPSLALASGVEESHNGLKVEDLVRLGRAQPTLPDALHVISESLKGTPYVLGNAGEGKFDLFDQDPAWRLDVQDCTTFVETVMALSMADSRHAFVRTLWRIRYLEGEVAFSSRNHFPEVDWIPNNVAAGYLRDITLELYPDAARTVRTVIEKSVWYSKMNADSIQPKERPLAERERLARQLRERASRYRPEPASLSYLPMQAMYVRAQDGSLQPNESLLRKIPHGSIFNIVREGWSPGGISMAVSHQGFIVQKDNGTFMRHASPGRGVVDDRIDQYFLKFLESPTIRGVNLLEVLDPPLK